MGLDISAYARAEGEEQGRRFHEWRKHYSLRDWCEALAVARGGDAWEEPAQGVELEAADLDALEAAVRAGDDPRERLASEIAAHQHTAFILPPSDEGFLNFVQAEVEKARMSELAPRAPENLADGWRDWRAHDLEFIEKARRYVREGCRIEVVFSW